MEYIKEIEDERCFMISKSNKMIRKSRFSLSALEQKIIFFLFSKIKPEDTDLTEYTFKIQRFCDICGIDYANGGNYQYIKKIIKGLRDKSFWVMNDDETETLCSWIRKANINKGRGIATMKLDEDILNYAIGLIEEGNYTQSMMIYTLPMQGKYSRQLYELLKSREHEINKYKKVSIKYGVDELKHFLQIKEYKEYYDFKKKVIGYAISEINEYSDLKVDYKEIPLKTGKRGKPPIGMIEFFIESREILDTIITRKVNNEILNKQAKIKK